jgi:hypothetical protein
MKIFRSSFVSGTIVLFAIHSVFAQPSIEWQKSLGGTAHEEANSILQISDGGFIVAGFASSSDGDVTGYHGNEDFWVVKLDSSGFFLWQNSLGGSFDDDAYDIRATTDGGYIMAGYSYSDSSDVTGNHGNADYWVVKLDSAGNMLWQKCLGGTDDDYAKSILQTSAGEFVVTGYSYSNDGDVTGHHGTNSYFDYWVVKLDSAGTLQWQTSLGGTSYDEVYAIQQTSDGGYVLAGMTCSNDGDMTGHHGGRDYWIVKLDSAGILQWQRSLGGTHDDEAHSIQQTTDGGYIVAGLSYSQDGDVTGHHGTVLYSDFWIVKTDSAGNIQWQRSFGGTGDDDAQSIRQTPDGGYITVGLSFSNDGNVTGNHGLYDDWIVRMDSVGNLQWQLSLGGTGDDRAFSVQLTSDGGLVIAGYSRSNDGNVTGHHGSLNYSDYWVIKLNGAKGGAKEIVPAHNY